MTKMEKEKEMLLCLIKVSLGSKEPNITLGDGCSTFALLQEASKQTVVALVADGLERCGAFQRIPFKEKIEWVSCVANIEMQNKKHRTTLFKTLSCIQNAHINVAFMKGLVVGSRYLNPLHRQCGDIDFVVDERDFGRVLDALGTIGTVDRSMKHEHHGMAFVDGIQLEPHYKVHNFQNPKVDKTMKGLFQEVFPNNLIMERLGDIEVPTFSPDFECVLLVGHMVNHVYAEGLGLRQVIDFMFFLQKKSGVIEWDKCHINLNMIKMERAFRIFVRICEKYLGLSKTILNHEYSHREMDFADKLMLDIMEVGNFGRGKNYLGGMGMLRPLRSYIWVSRRCLKLGFLCPAEAKWWPISKIKRYCWKNLL